MLFSRCATDPLCTHSRFCFFSSHALTVNCISSFVQRASATPHHFVALFRTFGQSNGCRSHHAFALSIFARLACSVSTVAQSRDTLLRSNSEIIFCHLRQICLAREWHDACVGNSERSHTNSFWQIVFISAAPSDARSGAQVAPEQCSTICINFHLTQSAI